MPGRSDPSHCRRSGCRQPRRRRRWKASPKVDTPVTRTRRERTRAGRARSRPSRPASTSTCSVGRRSGAPSVRGRGISQRRCSCIRSRSTRSRQSVTEAGLPVAALLYDVIPYRYPEQYLTEDDPLRQARLRAVLSRTVDVFGTNSRVREPHRRRSARPRPGPAPRDRLRGRGPVPTRRPRSRAFGGSAVPRRRPSVDRRRDHRRRRPQEHRRAAERMGSPRRERREPLAPWS